jgi:hypothetical protein
MLGDKFHWSSEDRQEKAPSKRRKPAPAADSPREVTLQDLGALPLRATVAFASRCARRTQPTFRPPEDFPHRGQAFDAIEAAIRLAEDFARGAAEVPGPNDTTARLVYQLGEATCGLQLFAPYAAYHAAHAATRAASAGERGSEDLASEVLAAAYGACRVVMTSGTGSRPDADSHRRVCAAVCADFDRLRGLALGSFRDLGGPVDATEAGPLGPLWTEGAPPGF